MFSTLNSASGCKFYIENFTEKKKRLKSFLNSDKLCQSLAISASRTIIGTHECSVFTESIRKLGFPIQINHQPNLPIASGYSRFLTSKRDSLNTKTCTYIFKI